MLKTTLYTLFTLLFFYTSPVSLAKSGRLLERAVTRAAFDLGSGKFKMAVGEYCNGRVNLIYSRMVDVCLAEDLAKSSDNTLSQEIQDLALKSLTEMKNEAEKLGAEQFSGIATEVFRRAKNGEGLLERLKETGVDLRIVSQQKEGEFGFNTAVVLSPEIDERKLVSWDSGNASFQLTAKEDDQFFVYKGPIGNSSVIKIFIEQVRGETYSGYPRINPVSLAECEQLCELLIEKIAFPEWLAQRLACPTTKVVTIGDSGSIFAIAAKGLGSNEYTLTQVEGLIKKLTGSSSDYLKRYREDAESVMTRLVLLRAVMTKFSIETVIFKESIGSTPGVLIDDDLWKESSMSPLQVISEVPQFSVELL